MSSNISKRDRLIYIVIYYREMGEREMGEGEMGEKLCQYLLLKKESQL